MRSSPPPDADWRVPTSVTVRTWRVPAAAPLDPGAGRRRTWSVAVAASAPGDPDTRARPMPRPALFEDSGDGEELRLPGWVDLEPATDVLAVDSVEERPVANDNRQRRMVGLAEALARQLRPSGDDDGIADEPPLTRPEGAAAPEPETEPPVEPDPLPDPRPGAEPVDEADPAPVGTAPAGVEPTATPEREREHGDRTQFLAQARARLANAPDPKAVHAGPVPLPFDLPHVDAVVPEPDYLNLSRDDLVGSFARAVEEAGGVCHRVMGAIPETLLDHLVAELGVWEAVVSADAEAATLAERLESRGVQVADATVPAAASAALGITSAVAGVAATGSLVLDSRLDHGRVVSVLPRVHICVLPADRIVATPADVLRVLGAQPAAMPSSLVLVTGPSRSGHIEQLLTVGAHGPSSVHVIVVEPATGDAGAVGPD